jgi:ElaB/YqjD/DUF883 family membrane-anchored ribosome-binding protein
METSVQPELSSLQSDIAQLRSDFTKMTSNMRGIAGNGIARAGDLAQESAGKVWDEVKSQAQQVGGGIEEWPLVSTLAAFSIGLMLGMLMTARRAG